MAYAGHYRHVFDIPVARRKEDVPPAFRGCTPIDLEFSEYGRAARFLPGWFLLPAMVLAVAIIAAVLLLV